MAITAAQRQIALQALTSVALNGVPTVPAGTSIATILPGVTAAQVWSTIATALGTSVDAQLTTVCANLVALLNLQLTPAQGSVSTLQAEITAATVV